MNIPDKAIEAAAQELYAEQRSTSDGFDIWPEWEDAPEIGRGAFRDEARAALKAAVPLIEAQALRDAASVLRGNLKRLETDRAGDAWLVRANDIGVLLARAEDLSPQ